MSDFSDRPFVAGVVTGLRAFRIDSLGRLTGVTYKDVWTPGENEAVCHKGETSRPFAAMGGIFTTTITSSDVWSTNGFDRTGKKAKGIPKIPAPREKAAKLVHQTGGVACECGFYAYFDGGNDYLRDDWSGTTVGSTQYIGGYIYVTGPNPDNAPRVAAIVNGWGLVTVGSRGFRAAKAEVVALISPASERARHEVAFAKVRRNYPSLALFETEQQAVREFPLTDPNPFSPETDDEFWTRSAT